MPLVANVAEKTLKKFWADTKRKPTNNFFFVYELMQVIQIR